MKKLNAILMVKNITQENGKRINEIEKFVESNKMKYPTLKTKVGSINFYGQVLERLNRLVCKTNDENPHRFESDSDLYMVCVD